jgi:cytochrome c oxidase subunit 2
MFGLSSAFITKIANTEAAEPWQLSFQDPATPLMEGIIVLHHEIMILLVIIGIFVGVLLFRAVSLFNAVRQSVANRTIHGVFLEIFWTVTPAVLLAIIANPSFTLLYSADELIEPAASIKAIGHQWYWSYEFSDYAREDDQTVAFDSYMVPDYDLPEGGMRLLEVDNRVVLPVETHIRSIVTSADVLHCWAIPSFAIKMDACPGRLNQASIYVKRMGVFYGQCSEICGMNHGFMPIVVEAVKLHEYASWIACRLAELEE